MSQNTSIKILSDLTVFAKYAKYIPEIQRRETWSEICDRVQSMHIKKYPQLQQDIINAMQFVRDKKVVPSMRSMQFAGKPIELNNSRIYNCSFTAIQTWKDFSEILFLLLSGTGVGFSVQKAHINKLPKIKKPIKSRKFLIGDSIEGWSDSLKALFKAYMSNGILPLFDYSDIRPKGAELVTAGGKAPGPEPLERCLNKIKSILDKKEEGTQLSSIEVHDVICHIADAVLSGGIRRAALISFFDKDDDEMLNCKGNFTVDVLNGGFHLNPQFKSYEGEVLYKNKAHYISLSKQEFELFSENKKLPWYYFEPQRARANNSVVLLRSEATENDFNKLWEMTKKSGSGEPGVYFTNDINVLSNPCGEISIASRNFCNLTEVNFGNVESEEDLINRLWAATLLGTLQAGYTDIHYLSSKWEDNAKEQALLGVSFTGICDNINYKNYDWDKISKFVLETNKNYAKTIGINEAERIGTVKPSGTVSLVMGTSSGIHARYANYYIRRLRFNKNEAIAIYLKNNIPNLVEDEFGNPNGVVVSIPIKAPEGSIMRTESPIQTLERVKFFNENWIRKTHRKGVNYHNVSCTINIKNNEWEKVGKWMWQNKESYAGISVLPYDGGTYIQAPFEECTEEKYNELITYAKDINLSQVIEFFDNTNLKDQAACMGGASCEIL